MADMLSAIAEQSNLTLASSNLKFLFLWMHLHRTLTHIWWIIFLFNIFNQHWFHYIVHIYLRGYLFDANSTIQIKNYAYSILAFRFINNHIRIIALWIHISWYIPNKIRTTIVSSIWFAVVYFVWTCCYIIINAN